MPNGRVARDLGRDIPNVSLLVLCLADADLVGAAGITGVDLLVDTETHVAQFYAITSAEQGAGRQIVEAVVSATLADWFLAVPMDWSGGFWERMARDYPLLQVF